LLVIELLFVMIGKAVLLIKFLECSIGVIRTKLVAEMIIMITPGEVREHVICFADIVELALGYHSILRVFLGVPLGRELLISVFNLCLRGKLGKTKSGVVILRH